MIAGECIFSIVGPYGQISTPRCHLEAGKPSPSLPTTPLVNFYPKPSLRDLLGKERRFESAAFLQKELQISNWNHVDMRSALNVQLAVSQNAISAP